MNHKGSARAREDRAYGVGGWYDVDPVKGDDGARRFEYLWLTSKSLSPYAEGWQPLPGSFEERG